MMRFFRYTTTLLAVMMTLATLSVSAQPSRGAEEVVATGSSAAGQDNFVIPKDAPYLGDEAKGKLFHIRNVNIHGVKYIDHNIIRSSSGLIPGDSIDLSGSFIQNAIMRL